MKKRVTSCIMAFLFAFGFSVLNNSSYAQDHLNKEQNNLYLCTFNVYILGSVEAKYDAVEEDAEEEISSEIPQRIKNLANVLAVGNFDLIVIEELTAGERGEWALSDLARELNQNHNGNYAHFMSGSIGRGLGINESIGFLYNPDIVQPQIIPGTTSLVQNLPISWQSTDSSDSAPRDFVRTQWVAGNFDFTLYAIHLAYGDEDQRTAGYRLTEDILTTPTPSSYSIDPDIIVLGDFNRFGKHDSIKVMNYNPALYLAPNVTYFDPNLDEIAQVPSAAAHGDEDLKNNPQLLSTTVAQNRYVYDIIFMTSDADEEYSGTASASDYGRDFGIIHYDESDGFGFQTGANQLTHNQLKMAYSDHRPLWMRFVTNGNFSDGNSTETVTNTQPANQVIYYATENGKKFHLKGCRTIKGKDTPITWTSREEALLTHGPCGVCKP